MWIGRRKEIRKLFESFCIFSLAVFCAAPQLTERQEEASPEVCSGSVVAPLELFSNENVGE